jgi:hypothetical protein
MDSIIWTVVYQWFSIFSQGYGSVKDLKSLMCREFGGCPFARLLESGEIHANTDSFTGKIYGDDCCG